MLQQGQRWGDGHKALGVAMRGRRARRPRCDAAMEDEGAVVRTATSYDSHTALAATAGATTPERKDETATRPKQ